MDCPISKALISEIWANVCNDPVVSNNMLTRLEYVKNLRMNWKKIGKKETA